MKNEYLWAAGVGLLRAVHLWTGRQYRRAVLRQALRRIGRELVAERRARKPGKLKAETKGIGPGQNEGTEARGI